MGTSGHPTDDMLRQCATGRLSWVDADELFEHLDSCADCVLRLDEVSRNTGSLAIALARADETILASETPLPLEAAIDRVLGKAPAAPEGLDDRLAAGTLISGYRILDELGKGGIGCVYRASHPRLEQDVALKVLTHSVQSSAAAARFEGEWQALSRMDHPNIARVMDGGFSADGQPYFVMELIRGSTISQFADERRLDVYARVQLFLQVCQAVQHAHQKGLIHRDLKPTNILVTEFDGRPIVKVIDFGIAKVLDRDASALDSSGGRRSAGSVTHAGVLIGTPEYMSPEQAGLNAAAADARSDVFALGVVLYEQLCGETPFRRAGEGAVPLLEQLRRIREDDLVSPAVALNRNALRDSVAARRSSTAAELARVLSGDLHWILQKALSKPPDDRYESVAQLAAELRAWLQHEPVSVGPPSRWYRLRKAVVRHRGTVISASLLLLSLIGGMISTLIVLSRVARERDDKTEALMMMSKERESKNLALSLEQKQRTRAAAANKQTLEALQTLTEETVERLLLARPELTDDDREFLTRILSQFEQFTLSTDGSVEARIVEAEAQHRIAQLYWRMGDREEAALRNRKAITLWQLLIEQVPEREDLRRAQADSYSNLGIVLAEMRQFKDAETAHRKAIEIHDRLAAEFPDDKSHLKNVANCCTSFGVMLKDVERNAETVEQYQRAINIQKLLLQDDPDNAELLQEFAISTNNMGIELMLLDRNEDGLKSLQETLELRTRLAVMQPDDPDCRWQVGSTLSNIGMAQGRLGNLSESIEYFGRARDELTKLCADYPAVTSYRQALVNTLDGLVTGLLGQKKYEELEIAALQLTELNGQLLRDDPANPALPAQSARTNSMRTAALVRRNLLAEADTACLATISDYRATLGLATGDIDARFNLANALMLRLRTGPAGSVPHAPLTDVEEACQLLTRLREDAPAHPKVAPLLRIAQMEQARLLVTADRSTEALAICDTLLAEKTEPSLLVLRARCLLLSAPESLAGVVETLPARDDWKPVDRLSLAVVCAEASARLTDPVPQASLRKSAESELAALRASGFFGTPEADKQLDSADPDRRLRDDPEFAVLLLPPATPESPGTGDPSTEPTSSDSKSTNGNRG